MAHSEVGPSSPGSKTEVRTRCIHHRGNTSQGQGGAASHKARTRLPSRITGTIYISAFRISLPDDQQPTRSFFHLLLFTPDRTQTPDLGGRTRIRGQIHRSAILIPILRLYILPQLPADLTSLFGMPRKQSSSSLSQEHAALASILPPPNPPQPG